VNDERRGGGGRRHDAAIGDEPSTLITRNSRPSAAALLATLSHVVTSMGAPSKTSGHQKCIGTAAILNAMPKMVLFRKVASAILSTMPEWYFSQIRGTA